MGGNQFVDFFIGPFVRFQGRQGLDPVKGFLRDAGSFLGLAAIQRDGEGDGLLPDNGSGEQVESGIGAETKLFAEVLKLFLDIRVKADGNGSC